MKRKIVSIASFLLAVILIASGLTAYAAGTGTPEKMKHQTKFVTGVVFIWGDSNGWKPAAPMQPYVVHTSAELGEGAQDVKIYPYNGKNFDPSKADFGKQNKHMYDNTYMPFAVTNMTPEIKAQPDSSGHISYDYTVTSGIFFLAKIEKRIAFHKNLLYSITCTYGGIAQLARAHASQA